MAKLLDPRELVPNAVLSDGETIPHLTDEEYATLRESIKAHGILQPVLISWPDKTIIDGHHRTRAAIEEKFDTVPVTLDETHTPDQQEEIGIQMNAGRRHWTREARNRAIRKRLLKAPHRSDRDVASVLCVDHKTVGERRKEMEATGEIPHFDFRTDKRGSKRKAEGTGAGRTKGSGNKSKDRQPPQGERSGEAPEADEASRLGVDVSTEGIPMGGARSGPSEVGDTPTGAPLASEPDTTTAPEPTDSAGDPQHAAEAAQPGTPVGESSPGAPTSAVRGEGAVWSEDVAAVGFLLDAVLADEPPSLANAADVRALLRTRPATDLHDLKAHIRVLQMVALQWEIAIKESSQEAA